MKKALVAELAVYVLLGTAMLSYAQQRRQSCPLRQPVAAPAPAAATAAAKPEAAQLETAKIETISPRRAFAMMGEGAVMVDVREPDEWKTVRVEKSVLIPLSEVKAQPKKAALGPKVLLMCHSGRRAKVAADAMKHLPGVEIFVIEGGITNWQKENLPVQKD